MLGFSSEMRTSFCSFSCILFDVLKVQDVAGHMFDFTLNRIYPCKMFQRT